MKTLNEIAKELQEMGVYPPNYSPSYLPFKTSVMRGHSFARVPSEDEIDGACTILSCAASTPFPNRLWLGKVAKWLGSTEYELMLAEDAWDECRGASPELFPCGDLFHLYSAEAESLIRSSQRVNHSAHDSTDLHDCTDTA